MSREDAFEQPRCPCNPDAQATFRADSVGAEKSAAPTVIKSKFGSAIIDLTSDNEEYIRS